MKCVATEDDGASRWRKLIEADLIFREVDQVRDVRPQGFEVTVVGDVEFEDALLHSWAKVEE